MIVVDASAWVVALVDATERGDRARAVLGADPVWGGPSHLPLEVLRTLARLERAHVLDAAAAEEFAAEVTRAEIRYDLPDVGELGEVWARRHDLSPYDAPYVVLAERHAAALVTLDARLARAAQPFGVDVVVP